MNPSPSRWALWLLNRLLPPEPRETLPGDLIELYETEILPERGPIRARLWFWVETLYAIVAIRRSPQPRPATATSRGETMPDFLGDLRFGARLLLRRPGFAALTLFTLAVGIGATTGIFSVVDPVLFRPMPFPEPGQIVMVYERDQDGLTSRTGFATYADVARLARSFSAVAALRDWFPTMTGTSEPERLNGSRVSQPYFAVLGVRPALGRDFRPDEDRPSAPQVVILSSGLWKRRFGGDSAIVGRQIILNGTTYSVVGVMPSDFDDVLNPGTQLWGPLRYDASLPYACRTCRHLRAVARLRPGVSPQQSGRELEILSHNLVRAYPKEYPAAGFGLRSLRDEVAGTARPALLAVLGAVGLVLLMTCANLASMLLARTVQRDGELALRAALGAGRLRVFRQLLVESLLVAAAGGLAGIAVAYGTVSVLRRIGPAALPRLDAIAVQTRVLLFALGITAFTGVMSGLAPAIHAWRRDLHGSLKSRGRTGGPPRLTRGVLVVSEIALALILLAGSGLMLRSLRHVLEVRLGFEPANVLSLQILAAGPRYGDDAPTRAFYARALEAVRAVPGVESAALVSQLPLGGNGDQYGIRIESKPLDNPELAPYADRFAVSPDYLATMRIPVIRGRGLTAQDDEHAPPVALINETLARREWPGEDPIGQRIKPGGEDRPWRTIVGIVADVRHGSLDGEQSNQMYLPAVQWIFADNLMDLVVRTPGSPAELALPVRQAIWSVDRDQPITKVAPMTEVVARATASRRFVVTLFEAFAGVAIILAAAGIYGVLSVGVSERAREIGIRGALGASRRDILRLVVGQGLTLTVAGIVVGAIGGLALTRLIAGLLFGVAATDPATFALGAVVMLVVAAAACSLPAWRAARMDPLLTLRQE